ncbi:TPA: nickel-dependent lactate racemase [Candidatus Poribacteria bacterium]|nr:nickel-dependent lactate racemase [Candidatus Poribacteria bacterium]HEX29706.1 nickel-dependent lactate racemase [Candidatus Poribacteria bacterium]
MKVPIRFGRGEVQIEIPDENLGGILKMNPVSPIDDPVSAVYTALRRPIKTPPLSELARGKSSACVVISDITRPVPNRIILPPILETLEKSGISRGRITILIATGIHRPNLGEELEELVGEEIMHNYRIVNHYSGKPETHLYLGKTKRGTPVYLDRTYLEADLKILTGLIEPHLMAGFSGGRKSICPGISSVETMKYAHGPMLLEDERAAPGILEGNPFHEEATEVAMMAGVDFILNVTIDEKRRITGVFAGDLVGAHLAGVRFCERAVKVVVDEPADIVVTSSAGYPLDTTFYQAIKGAVGVLDVVKPGGTIILIAECSEGIGSEPFTKLMIETKDLDKFIRDLYDLDKFVVDQWQFEELVKVLRKAEVYCYSTGIDYETLKELFVVPLRSPQEGLDRALGKHGSRARVYAVPEGPYVLPMVRR